MLCNALGFLGRCGCRLGVVVVVFGSFGGFVYSISQI
jgi:hypothetical protein